ncbi:MAG: helix-turn-helix domain-containing protein [Actinomycetota bacterium]|nr:helix-turn-helix domain-containing protein [Actinomycetota bacterium]
MTLSFRNVDADPAQPVETWPYEAMVAAIERGSVSGWARLTAAIRRHPWGDVARSVEAYLGYAEPSGVSALLDRAIRQARADTEAADRAQVAARVRSLVAESGLTAAEFASRVGTSSSRLSTYVTGKVVPSAAMMLRMERVAADR